MDAEIFIEGKRRRSWPDQLKRQIVAESYDPNVSVSEVARRHDLDPAQLFAWRKAFQKPAADDASGFLPIEVVLQEEVR